MLTSVLRSSRTVVAAGATVALCPEEAAMHDLVRKGRGRGLGRRPDAHRPTAGTGKPGRRVFVPARPRPRPFLLLAAIGVVGLLVAGLTLLLSGGGPQSSVPGLPTAGLLTGWGLPLMRVLADLAAVGCVGALLVGAVLTPSGAGPLAGACARAVAAASSWAAGWAAACALTVLLTVSDVEGVPVSQVVRPGAADLAWQLPQTRALLAVAVLAAVVSVLTARVTTVTGARWAATVAVVALLPPLYTGHSAHAADHAVATESLVVHVVAATAWIGGLLGIVLHLRRPGVEQLRAVPRFSALALLCFCAVGASGLLAALARLGYSVEAWSSAYGLVLVAKMVALVALGGFGWRHRARTMHALRAGAPRAFWRLAAGELVLMAGAMGLAVALSRTPAPDAALGTDTFPTGIGWWQPDVIAVVAILAALVAYLNGVRLASCLGFVRPGHPGWPRARTTAAVLAAGVALVMTGVPTRPSSANVVSVGVAQYLALIVVVPVLVALAAPGQLDRFVRSGAEAEGPAGRLVRLFRDPVNAFLLVVAATAATWATPLGSAATRSQPLHLLVEASALVAGTTLFRSVLEDGPALSRLSGRDRAILLLVTAGFFAGFAAALGNREPVPGTTAAGAGVASVAQVLADQHRAAALLVAAAVALAATAVAGVLRGRRTSDQRKTSAAPA
jgi:putative copper export protein/cytochrome c oxidase assembly factor CtaG